MGQFLIALACVYVALCGKGWASSQEEVPLQTLTRAQVGTLYPAFSAEIEDMIARLPTPPRDEDCRVLMVHPTLGAPVPREYHKRITLIEQLYKVDTITLFDTLYTVDPLEETQPEDWTVDHGISFFGKNTAYLAVGSMAAKALDLPMSVLEAIVNTRFIRAVRPHIVGVCAKLTHATLGTMTFDKWVTLRVLCERKQIDKEKIITKVISGEETLAAFGDGSSACTLCHQTHPLSLLQTMDDPERASLVSPFLLIMEHHRFACQEHDYCAQRNFYEMESNCLRTAPLTVLKTLGHEDFSPLDRWRLLVGVHGMLSFMDSTYLSQPGRQLESFTYEKLLRINQYCALATWGARDSLLPLTMPHLDTIGTLLKGMRDPKKMTDMIRIAARQEPSWLSVFANLKTPTLRNKIPPENRTAYLRIFVERSYSKQDMQVFMDAFEDAELRIDIPWNTLIERIARGRYVFQSGLFHDAKTP